jgi:hypothetical protein
VLKKIVEGFSGVIQVDYEVDKGIKGSLSTIK